MLDFFAIQLPLLSSSAASALAQFHAFSSELLVNGFKSVLSQASELNGNEYRIVSALNLIVEHTTRSMTGMPKDLFAKSIHEALCSAAPLEGELNIQALEHGVITFVEKQGAAELLQRLLCLYVFNTVWFQLQDKACAAGKSFEHWSQHVEERCVDAVSLALRKWRSQTHPRVLTTNVAKEFLREIETNLRA